ncbi:solute carrier family 66 member 2 isoform X2 [Bemisia tabaci]|uniref:solute carrier family 66 member 2 isoform X2 n=1 Tax=Bemisia tabaci TaxID=7038 RepID=UPI0008F99B28|nr:PREDICTED: PQ-loop repeat-containing protein 1 isoform X2 [Bemisia tabaci]
MEAIMEEVRDVSMSKVIKWVCATIMIFGGIVPYIPQYQEIYQKEDAEGFSLYVCLALLIANTLRILFWFGKRYELPLLLQSIVMNIMMLLMIHLCVKVRNKNQLKPPIVERTFTDFDLKYFWQWTDFQSYVDFLLVMNISFSLITFICIHSTVFVEVLGFLAVFTEACLGVPQLVKNLRQRSTEGMSVYMVLMWTAGDAFKTVYFIVREAPLQFWLCGALQVIIDLTILGQVYWYRNSIPSFRYGRAD